jgi:hypothetical protein
MPAVVDEERYVESRETNLDESAVTLLREKLCRVNPMSARDMK